MSWKPSRSSGVLFDKYTRNAEKHRELLGEMIPKSNPPKFEDIKKLSKHFYLYYLNDNKAKVDITGSDKYWNPFHSYCDNYFLRIFRNNPQFVYKPLLKVLNL